MTFSQEYYPLVEENRTWNVISVVLTGPYPGDTSFSTLTYEFFGDTIIDSKTYLKLFKSSEENPLNWTLDCFMREENKKAWYRHVTNEHEVLMYNFNLNVGDSILDMTESNYMIVDSIGYQIINQEERKKYWLSSIEMPEYNETWIDGIGSSKGICFGGTVLFVGGWTWFLCLSENGDLIYMNPNYNSCFLTTETNEILFPNFDIYPNPTKEILFIQNRQSINIKSITISDINGLIIKSFNTATSELDISDLSSGLYFLNISSDSGIITKKVIIE